MRSWNYQSSHCWNVKGRMKNPGTHQYYLVFFNGRFPSADRLDLRDNELALLVLGAKAHLVAGL